MEPVEEDSPASNPAAETIAAHVGERPRTDRLIGPEPLTTLSLEVVGGPMDGVSVHVARDEILIGRGPQCDLSLRLDPMVSNVHSRVVREGSSYWLEDLESRNGTFVGDQRIQGRTLIGPGTIFVLGSTCVEFLPN